MKRLFLVSLSMVACFCACSVQSGLKRLETVDVSGMIAMPGDEESNLPDLATPVPDTLKVRDIQGDEVLIMRAVRDEDGEMVATDVLDAAMVTARFRNVAERMGKVDLRFRVTVPSEMLESNWQIRLYPKLIIADDVDKLDPVLVTGALYRNLQLRGYQQYERFLRKIIEDPELMINVSQLEIFLKRNIPALYAFKTDTTYVSDEKFYSCFGLSEQDAIDHYTNKFRVWQNERRKSLKDAKFRKFVKSPIVSEGLRLDTVIRDVNGDFIYDYIQTITAGPKLRKVDVTMDGGIFEQGKRVYTIPESAPLSYYISSLSTLVEDRDRYLTEVVSRRVEANTACYIEFPLGSSEIKRELGYNEVEISRIEENIRSLAINVEYDVDSIIVTASASPEGTFQHNKLLALRRSNAVSEYFKSYYQSVADSERGFSISLDDSGIDADEQQDIRFISMCNPENWQMLDALVRDDREISDDQKARYFEIAKCPDPDTREALLSREEFYVYLRESLYPRLRTVKFDFHLHRKGMTQDTVCTTVIDTVYQRGIQALRDREYETAVTLLRPYEDFNSALAFCAMDYNASAISVLSALEPEAKVNYLLALLYSRQGNDHDAVECYLKACAQDPAFVHRGNLDPEISTLIGRYALDLHQDEL